MVMSLFKVHKGTKLLDVAGHCQYCSEFTAYENHQAMDPDPLSPNTNTLNKKNRSKTEEGNIKAPHLSSTSNVHMK